MKYITLKEYNWTNISLSIFFSLLLIYQLVVTEIVFVDSLLSTTDMLEYVIYTVGAFSVFVFDVFVIGIICVHFEPYSRKYKVKVEGEE